MIKTSSKSGSISFINLLLIFIIFPLNAKMSEALDNPHNVNNTINCADCHVSSPPAGWWTDQGSTNGICSSCHNDTTAVFVKTHSSANTSAKYGTWYKKCTDCHNPHYQRQNRIYKAESYLATGQSTGVTTSTLTKTGANWDATGSGEWAGIVLLPDVRYPSFNYRIASNTSDTITIDTGGGDSINLTYIKPGATFAIVYGRILKEYVGGRTTKFFRTSGVKSFADGDATYDGICEVCHTKTQRPGTGISRYRNTSHSDSHFEAQNCVVCHEHAEGFKASCASCHGNPPATDTASLPDGLVWNPSPTGSAEGTAHIKHATGGSNYSYTCETCHYQGMPVTDISGNNKIQIGFYLFGGAYTGVGTTYKGQSLSAPYSYEFTNNTTVGATQFQCINIYCHGRLPDGTVWGGGNNTGPMWNGTIVCGDCHGAAASSPPSRGSHSKHAQAYDDGYQYSCSLCHKDPSSDKSLHANNKSEIIFSADPKVSGGNYGGTEQALDAYGTCTNLYCHSTVQSSPPGGSPTYRTTPAWGDNSTLGCTDCHDSSPSLATGSHNKHFYNYDNEECFPCHNYSNDDDPCMACHSFSGYFTPRDRHANYIIDVNFSPMYGGSYSGTSAPNDAYGSCSNLYCHGNYSGSGLNATPTWGNSATAACGSCHGGSNTSVPNSGTHALHAGGYNFSCTLCHQGILSGTGPSNYIIADKAKHASRYIDWAFDTTDSRVSASSTYSIASGTSVPSDGTTPRAYGTCNNIYCHSNVQPDGGMGGPTAFSTPVWGDPDSALCGTCHKTGVHGDSGPVIDTGSHTAHLAYDFNITGTIKCSICHKIYTSNTSGLNCVNCHNTKGNLMEDVLAKHSNYNVNISFDTTFGSPIYSGTPAPGDGYSNCANTYCHSNGTSVSTSIIPNNNSSNWGSGTLACNACHGNPPDYTNGTPKANSHLTPAHSGYTCNKCHFTATNDGATISDTVVHVNNAYNVDPGSGELFTYTFAPAGGTCTNVSCHTGNATRTWGQ